MADANNKDDLYEVILIYSGVGYAAICPGIPSAVSQGTDQQDALAMIADAMAMCRMYPLPGEEKESRREELQELGKAKITELVAECEEGGLEYYVCEAAPKLIRPWLAVG